MSSQRSRFLFMTSFIPILVVFTNAIRSCNTQDAELLSKVAKVMHNLRHSSEELSRLCVTCTSLANHATTFVQREFFEEPVVEDDALMRLADSAMSDADAIRELFGSDANASWL